MLLIDNLILAYRSKFYDWDKEQLKSFILKNRILIWVFAAFILSAIGTLIYCIYSQSSVLMIIFLIAELILGILADRVTVKRYQKFILAKQDHLNDVVLFLQTAVPNNNLYTSKQIDEMIQRLTERIDASIPFKAFKSNLSSFGKAIILPAITFIAGVYSSTIGQIDFWVVLTWTLSGIFLLGTLGIMWGVLSNALQKITCRDYDAAISFREDLLDIQLLFFTTN